MPYITTEQRAWLDKPPVPSTPGGLAYRLTRLCLAEPDNPCLADRLLAECVCYLDTICKARPRYRFFDPLPADDDDEPRKLRFEDYALVLGVLEAVAQEYNRRRPEQKEIAYALFDVQTAFYDQHVAPYEDQKIKENGDVF